MIRVIEALGTPMTSRTSSPTATSRRGAGSARRGVNCLRACRGGDAWGTRGSVGDRTSVHPCGMPLGPPRRTKETSCACSVSTPVSPGGLGVVEGRAGRATMVAVGWCARRAPQRPASGWSTSSKNSDLAGPVRPGRRGDRASVRRRQCRLGHDHRPRLRDRHAGRHQTRSSRAPAHPHGGQGRGHRFRPCGQGPGHHHGDAHPRPRHRAQAGRRC